MPFESLRELSNTVRKYELQAWDSERQTSSAMAVCYAIVFFTYALLFLPITQLGDIQTIFVVLDSLCMVIIGLTSLAYSYLLKNKVDAKHLHKMPLYSLVYHTFLISVIFLLWALGNNTSISPMYVIVICLGFTWLHIFQYLTYITVLLVIILAAISMVEFNYFWFLEFVLVYLFAVTLHIFHVSQQCRIFNYQKVIEKDRNLDSLTGLLNRRALEETFLLPETDNPYVASILVDLDYFKNVNDTFGHAAGDQALTYAADIFKRVFRRGDLVARLGGDEFLIILQLDQDAETILKRKIDLLLHQVPLTFRSQEKSVAMAFSVGAYLCKRTGTTTVENLIAKADAAMYRVKQDGRNAALITTESGNEFSLQGRSLPVKVIDL